MLETIIGKNIEMPTLTLNNRTLHEDGLRNGYLDAIIHESIRRIVGGNKYPRAHSQSSTIRDNLHPRCVVKKKKKK